MRPGDRVAEGYVLLMGTVFLLAAPFFAAGGGYSCMTGFKAAVYAALTAAFLAASLLADRKGLRDFPKSPERLLAAGYVVFCLASALASPWRRAALLGGSRREGFLHLALYALSFCLVSLRKPRRAAPLVGFAAAAVLMDGLCLLQLRGLNPLGLYPEGLGWADANLRYAGSYLGTVGNAGQTGVVLAPAAALFFLVILQRSGKAWALLPALLLSAWVLGCMDVTAPIFALGAIMLLAPLPLVSSLRAMLRWGCLTGLTAAALLSRLLPPAVCTMPALVGTACGLAGRFLPGDRPLRHLPRCLTAALALALGLFVFTYGGWYAPLRELAGLLHGQVDDSFGSGRLYIWRQVLAAVPGHLWLGTGPDTLALRGLAPYVYAEAAADAAVTLRIDAAHCEALHTLACCGLPAALCRLALDVCAAVRFFRAQSPACAGAALCYAAVSLTGISMCASAPVFWLLLALSLAEDAPPAILKESSEVS